MKKCLILIALLMGSAVQQISADTITTPLKELNDGNDDDMPPVGNRLPARPIQCTIDTDTKEVILTPYVEDIEAYEIWDEGQNVLLFSTDDPAEFVDQVMTYDTPVLIAISTADHTYIGYL